jgi:hypothetical protein
VSAAEQLLGALRETLRSAGKPKRFVADVAAVLAAYGDLEQVLAATEQRWVRLQETLRERSGDAERTASMARALLARAHELRGAVAAARNAVEGVRLAALSAGLEGARRDDGGGAALIRLSDEVRERSAGAVEALDELGATLERLDRDRDKLKEGAGGLERELSILAVWSRDEGIGLDVARRALVALGEAIERATGTDPELAPLLASAAEHARGLASALSQLGSRDGARLALRSLQPLLEPLVTVLGDIYGEGREER